MQTPHQHNTFDTKLVDSDNALERMAIATTKLGMTVTRTLGPGGSNVVLDRAGAMPVVTKDGVTVFYDLDNFGGTEEDKIELIVYEMIRDAADKVNKAVGDGTTTVVFLIWQALLRARKILTRTGIDHRKVSRGFTEAMEAIRNNLAGMVEPANNERALRASLHTSSNGEEEIINTLTEVFLDVGDEGMIFIRDPQSVRTVVNFEEGFVLSTKIDTPELLEDGRLSWTDPYVAVMFDNIQTGEEILPIMQDVQRRGNTKKIVLAYTRMSDVAKNWIIRNNRESEIDILPFKIPMYAERQEGWGEDIAALTDATVISKKLGVDNSRCGIEELGKLDELQADSYAVKLIGGRGTKTNPETGKSKLDEHIEFVESDRNCYTGNFHERNRMNERLAKLTGAVVSIHPGATSEIEMKRKRGVYEDSVLSGQAAIRGGVVPGGGYSLYKSAALATTDVTDYEYLAGWRIATETCGAVFRKICKDFGKRAQSVDKELKILDGLGDSSPAAYNFRTDEYGHMFEVKVVDPHEMLDLILEEVTGLVSLIMTVGGVLVFEAEEGFVTWKEKHQKMAALRYR